MQAARVLELALDTTPIQPLDEPESKLLTGSSLGDYVEDYYRGYQGRY